MARKTKKKLIKNRKNNRKINSWLYWSPRILTILFILFISLFALDIFGNGYTFWETVVGLFMHLIPSMILIIFLLIAWRHEWVGALGFLIFAVWYVCMTLLRNDFQWYYLAWSIELGLPAVIIAVLWWLNWKRKNSK